MNKALTFLIFTTVFTLAGCVPDQTIDDMNLIQGIGYDYVSGKKVRGTFAFPGYGRGEQNTEIKNVTFSAVSETSEGIRKMLHTESPKPLKIGQLLIVIYSREVAKHGIFPLVDSIRRDPDVGRLLYLAVSEQKAQKILKMEHKSGLTAPMYLNGLIEHNMEKNVPKTNLHTFLYSYYGKGMDPFLPMLKKEKDHVVISGLALFRGDRYVGKIAEKDLFVFSMLYRGIDNGAYEMSLEKLNTNVAVNSVSSSVKYRAVGPLEDVVLHADVEMKAVLDDAGRVPKKVKLEKKIPLIEKELAKELEKKGEKMIQKLQKLKTDPLRLGDVVRSYYRNWSAEKWNKRYPEVDVRIHVNVNIVQSGIVR